MRRKAGRIPGIPLKWSTQGLDLLTDSLALNSNSGAAARDILGGTELSGFRVRAGGVAYSQIEVLAEATVY